MHVLRPPNKAQELGSIQKCKHILNKTNTVQTKPGSFKSHSNANAGHHYFTAMWRVRLRK